MTTARFASVLGLLVFIFLAWLLSSDRRNFPWRIVVCGLGLQIALAGLVLRTELGLYVFQALGAAITRLLDFVKVGALFVVGFNGQVTSVPNDSLLFTFAFGVLPTIVFFSSLMAVLYQIGLMPRIVWAMAWIMRTTLGTSGPETLAAAANVFVGHTEAPLVIRPYLPSMTRSELCALMTGGFATVTGGLIGVYAGMGIDPTHLLTASVISAPAALLISKVMQPEAAQHVIDHRLLLDRTKPAANVIGAAVQGASDGMKLAINVAAMLIAFLALLALLDALLGGVSGGVIWAQERFGITRPIPIDLRLGTILGYVFAPLAWLCGIPYSDIYVAGKIIGTKTVANEFIAYQQLSELVAQSDGPIADRTRVILTYALAGFSNFGAIGIQVGGIGGLVPERKDELANLGLRAMVGGTLACLMTAAIAGMLLI
jgi:concentrative nucleoside transporter, CNT family